MLYDLSISLLMLHWICSPVLPIWNFLTIVQILLHIFFRVRLLTTIPWLWRNLEYCHSAWIAWIKKRRLCNYFSFSTGCDLLLIRKSEGAASIRPLDYSTLVLLLSLCSEKWACVFYCVWKCYTLTDVPLCLLMSWLKHIRSPGNFKKSRKCLWKI